MSRSIHTTYKTLILERRNNYSDDEIKKRNLKKLYKDIDVKKQIKKSVQLDKKRTKVLTDLADSFNTSTLDIRYIDNNEYVHYLVTEQDIIEIIKRLPLGVLSGIDSITFCLGKEYQEKASDNGSEELRDPFTGRICCNEKGPIYFSPVNGTYYPETCKIFLYAFVYDKRELKLNVIEPYLKLQKLATFVHEVAHHDDNMRRSRRGRWIGVNEWKCEDYADLCKKHWIEEAVVPYLLEQYPEEYKELSNWVKEYGGVDFSLIKLAGERGGRNIDGLVSLGTSASVAVEELFINVISEKPREEAMIEFAKELHFADYYEECIKSLGTLLTIDPNNSEAIGIKADTYIHLEKYHEAEMTANKCLSIDENNTDALEALCDVQQQNGDWKLVQHTSFKGIVASKDDSWQRRRFLQLRIISSLHLGEYENAMEDANLLPEDYNNSQRKTAFLALVEFLSGNTTKAFELSMNVMCEDKIMLQAGAILRSILNRVPIGKEEKSNRYELSEYENNYLIYSGIGELFEE